MANYDEINGSIVAALIVPSSPADIYATHIDKYGRGGYKAVTSMAERDAIPINRLCLGAEVRVTIEDGTSTVYYVSKMPDNLNEEMTGADCEWSVVKNGLSDDDLAAFKGEPGGLAELDENRKVPLSQSRSMIFRGKYVNETSFVGNNGEDHPHWDNAVYITTDGKLYSWSSAELKFKRDTMYWQDV